MHYPQHLANADEHEPSDASKAYAAAPPPTLPWTASKVSQTMRAPLTPPRLRPRLPVDPAPLPPPAGAAAGKRAVQADTAAARPQ